MAIVIGLQAAGVRLARADADFGNPLLDTANHLPARPLLQVDPQQLMGIEEAREIVGEELHDRREIGEHADMAADALRIFR